MDGGAMDDDEERDDDIDDAEYYGFHSQEEYEEWEREWHPEWSEAVTCAGKAQCPGRFVPA